jgi:hypothetical protein
MLLNIRGYLEVSREELTKINLNLYNKYPIMNGIAIICDESSVFKASFAIITKSCQYIKIGMNKTIKDLIQRDISLLD